MLFMVLIFILGVVLILLVLIQRGRGGGLAGVLGGAGGSSPFGSRAGDTFTRATLIVALAWIVLNMVQILWIMPPKEEQPPPSVPPAESRGTGD
jgi:preprotein translocase subunit SecG